MFSKAYIVALLLGASQATKHKLLQKQKDWDDFGTIEHFSATDYMDDTPQYDLSVVNEVYADQDKKAADDAKKHAEVSKKAQENI